MCSILLFSFLQVKWWIFICMVSFTLYLCILLEYWLKPTTFFGLPFKMAVGGSSQGTFGIHGARLQFGKPSKFQFHWHPHLWTSPNIVAELIVNDSAYEHVTFPSPESSWCLRPSDQVFPVREHSGRAVLTPLFAEGLSRVEPGS